MADGAVELHLSCERSRGRAIRLAVQAREHLKNPVPVGDTGSMDDERAFRDCDGGCCYRGSAGVETHLLKRSKSGVVELRGENWPHRWVAS